MTIEYGGRTYGGRLLVLPTCRDCGQHHETGADAMRCDHERHIERPYLHGGLHALNQVRGCPICEARRGC